VYSDDDVTIIERDGERQVIRHTPSPASPPSPPDESSD
jgi:hypothetical protein